MSIFSALKVGQKAPHFKLKGVSSGKEGVWDLSILKNKWVVLFFYGADFTPHSQEELTAFQAKIIDYVALDVQVIGCSVDSISAHIAWSQALSGIDYPLLSDIHHTTSIDYNVFQDEEAQAQNGIFVIDPEGVLRFYQIQDSKVKINVGEILRIVEVLQAV